MTEAAYTPPPDVENAALLAAMDSDARRKDWPTRKNLYETFLSSMLLVPVLELPAGIQPGETVLMEPLQLTFRYDVKPTGEKWTVVFTDEEALREWDTVYPFVRIDARSTFKMMLDAGMDQIFVNLFREHPTRPGGSLFRSEFEMLATGLIPVQRGDHHVEMQGGAGAALIEPPVEPLPASILAALPAAAKPLRGLTAISHFRLSFGGGPRHDALGLRCGVGLFPLSADQVAKRLMQRIQPLLDESATLDLLPIHSDDHEALKKGHVVWRRP